MKTRTLPLFGALFLAALSQLHAQRISQVLNTDWKFLRADAKADAKTSNWEQVTVPHTWNAADGANGTAADPDYPEGYYRGPGWYERALPIPAEWKGKRIFLRFEGVSIVADVFINRIPIGRHEGAFGAFCFEATPYLQFDGKDSLRVRVDNSIHFNVAPLSGDFTVCGGIYRPVTLIATDSLCVSPLEHGSHGVFLTVKKLTKEKASVECKVLVSSGTAWPTGTELQTEIKDASGATVAKATKKLNAAEGKTSTFLQPLEIKDPHLWNGRQDPYLYSATVRILQEEQVLDEVTQPLGIRTVALYPKRGFLLNGKVYPLHGVNRHQEREGKGWALSNADHDEDHALITEMGANTIRLAHYQQAEYFHDLCDRSGLILWQELPVVDLVAGSPQYLENARQQLKEMIFQSYNHPSVAICGLSNELDAPWPYPKTAPAVPVMQDLNRLAKELDPTRPTGLVSFAEDAGERHRIADAIGWNIYPGWYRNMPEDATAWIQKYSGQVGKKIGITEYGAGANPHEFQEGELTRPDTKGPFHPQEWQNLFHEKLWAQLKENPQVWGTWIWAMFDFASDKRSEGEAAGINDKGLVTRDRKLKKDTFYFYKANWNPEPMVYLASRRATPRKIAITDVKAYSNCEKVELKLNGTSLGIQTPDTVKLAVWKGVQLQPGDNLVEVIAIHGNKTLTDSCHWVLETPKN